MQKLNREEVALAYEEAGTGDPAVLLVHCWCCDHTFLAPQFEHFRVDHRTIAVDLRGHGESDKPHQDYTVSGFADDLFWLCGQLGVERPVVIGHSMGGNIALELAARHPEFATAIVMIDSGIVLPAPLLEMLKQGSEALKGPEFRETNRSLVDSITLATDDAGRTTRIKDIMSSAPQHVMSNSFDQHLLVWDAAAAASACKVPALYIGAAIALSDLTRFRQLCPQLVVGQTVGAGHFNNQEVPDQVNAMIDRFLTVSAKQ